MNPNLQSDSLARASIDEGQLTFQSSTMLQALQDGCFFLAAPAHLDMAAAVRFAHVFFRPTNADDTAYTGYKDRPDVYFDRQDFQTEHVLIDQHRRAEYFDDDLNAVCDQLSLLTQDILRAVLTALHVDETRWELLTQGASSGHGTQWIAFNHYRPEKRVLGCTPHKDTGFVTVLYAPRPGLEGWTGSTWAPIDAPDGYLIVNFGGSFESMTAHTPHPVTAMLHRVRETEATPDEGDRFSIAAFANPPATGEMHQLQPDGTVTHVESVEAFLRRFNDEAWGDEYAEFGIKVGTAHD